MARRLLLLSNSTNPGEGYLDHCASVLTEHFGEGSRVAFVPYALFDHDGYAAKAEERFARMGIEARSVHRSPTPAQTIGEADGIFVGGGNTFRLLDRVIRTGLREAIREAIAHGIPYAGASAGSNLACPTIKTTNDMPIVEPPTFDALGLVEFQINPHYVERDPDTPHGGETRRQRIAEFLEEVDLPVIGLPEGSGLVVDGDAVEVLGDPGAVLFLRGSSSIPLDPGARVDEILGTSV